MHLDHAIPRGRPLPPGAPQLNLIPACSRCNMNKGQRDPHQWRAKLLADLSKHIRTAFLHFDRLRTDFYIDEAVQERFYDACKALDWQACQMNFRYWFEQ